MRSLCQNLIRTWREHAGMQVATLTVLTGTYTVVTLFFFLHANFSRILSHWGESVQLAVFLKDSASSAQISGVQDFLKGIHGIENVKFISKEAAAESFQKQMGHYSPQLLTDPEFGNPLPASLEVHFQEGVSSDGSYGRMVEIAKQLASMAGVEDVSYGQGWVENYASLLRVFSSSSYLLIVVLLSGSLLVVGNAIRSSIHQRREEIEVLELVGATPFNIRLPYLFEGAVLGGMAATLSLLFCFLLYRWQQAVAMKHLGFWGLASEVGFLGLQQSLAVLTLGILFGAFGSYLCVRRIATGWAAAERG
ncbi:MAG: cell division protein FtsX [Bdellovibrionales bacterium]